MKPIHRLDLSWSTSRGVDTYGYNIARLDDSISGKRFRCMGGGYDMIGTVFGEWFQTTYPEKLIALRDGAWIEDCGYAVAGYSKISGLYGLTFGPDGTPHMDGACGMSSMQKIVEACGFEVQWSGNRNGQTRAYYVQEKS